MIWIILYILSIPVATVVIAVIDGNSATDNCTYLAGALIWPALLLIGAFIALADGLSKVADWIIEWRAGK